MEAKEGSSSRERRSKTTSSSGTSTSTAAAAAQRKETERRRRQDMKDLCLKLASLIPKEHYSKDAAMTQMDSLDEAAAYIKKLKERMDELQHRRSSAQSCSIRGAAGDSPSSSEDLQPPVVEVRYDHDVSSLDVVLICSAQKPFKFHEVITVLEEEGAEILNANFSVAGHKIFCTIYSRALSSRIGIEAWKISERLRALVH